jgi:hypothetical protein
MKTTDWHVYNEGPLTSLLDLVATTYRIRATYGMHKIGEQEPYFSITCDIEEKRGTRFYESGGGAAHALIREHLPELAPLIKWHLFSYPSGPMHYVENAIYFWQQATDRSKWPRRPHDADPMEAFKSTIVCGAVPGDEERLIFFREHRAGDVEVQAWLAMRLPTLRRQFEREMRAAGIELAAGCP